MPELMQIYVTGEEAFAHQKPISEATGDDALSRQVADPLALAALDDEAEPDHMNGESRMAITSKAGEARDLAIAEVAVHATWTPEQKGKRTAKIAAAHDAYVAGLTAALAPGNVAESLRYFTNTSKKGTATMPERITEGTPNTASDFLKALEGTAITKHIPRQVRESATPATAVCAALADLERAKVRPLVSRVRAVAIAPLAERRALIASFPTIAQEAAAVQERQEATTSPRAVSSGPRDAKSFLADLKFGVST